MKMDRLLMLIAVMWLATAALGAALGGQAAADETSVWVKDGADQGSGADKRARFINSVRERTSLTNQLTPHNSVKRLVTPQTTFAIDRARPPLPQPGTVPGAQVPAESAPIQTTPR